MSPRNEIVDLLCSELERYGLKGEVGDRSKHLEVRFNTPIGERFIIAPKTSSDWRAGLNSRSDLRKMLKELNIQPKKEEASSFHKAMSLPKEPTITKAVLDMAMQRDVEALVDLVFELQVQIAEVRDMQNKIFNAKIVSTVTSTVESQLEFAEKADERVVEFVPMQVLGTKQDNVLAFLSPQWVEKREIIKRAKVLYPDMTPAHLNQILQVLRRKGLIENGLRGMWRKVHA